MTPLKQIKTPFLGDVSVDKIFSALFWLALAVVWGTALISPIYPDEIAYRLINSRVFFDHWQTGNIYPPCTSGFYIDAPMSWMPARAIDYAAFGWYDNPAFYRLVSFIVLVANFTGIRVLLRRLGYGAVAFRIFILALSFGTIPFAFILVRPEAWIFASLVWLAAICLDPKPTKHGGALSGALVFLLSSMIMSVHPKTFMLAPVLAILFWVWSRRKGTSKTAIISCAAALGFLIYESANYWPRFAACPENPYMQSVIDSFALPPKLLTLNPDLFLQILADNLTNSWQYVKHALYLDTYTINWLPDQQQFLPYFLFNAFSNSLFMALLVAGYFIVVLNIAYFAKTFRHPKLALQVIRAKPHNLVSIFLLVYLTLYAGVNTPKNFYDIAFMFPLFTLLVFLYIPDKHRIENFSQQRSLRIALPLTAVMMAGLVYVNFLTALWDGYSGPSISLMSLSDERVREEITTLSPMCEIPQDKAKISHLIVDDLTYQYFHESYKPILLTWLAYTTPTINKWKFVSRLKTAGILARCDVIDAGLKNTPYFHTSTGNPDSPIDLCCLDKRYYDAR